MAKLTNILAAFLVLLSVELQAKPLADLFADQRSVYSTDIPYTEYRLSLSALKKINNEWIYERDVRIKGHVTKRTVELDRNYSVNETLRSVENHIKNLNVQALYACDGLDCGSSNAWANNHFKVKQLYGLDQSQHYRVWSLDSNGGRTYVVVYLVQRGNHRIYAQLEVIEPEDGHVEILPSAEVVAERLYDQGFLIVPGLHFHEGGVEFDENSLNLVAKALNAKPFVRLFLVGHDFGPGDLENQMKVAKSYAESVKEALISAGVSANRIETKAVGSLAPLDALRRNRVVIVIR